MFFIQATAACLSTCIKLCARLCICIEPSCVTANRSCLSEFPARISPPHASWVIVSLHSAVPVRIFLGRGSVVGKFFFLFQYLPLSDFRKNIRFNHPKAGKGLVSTCASAFLIVYVTFLFDVTRERERQTLVEFKHPSNAISLGRQLWWSFRNVAVMSRVSVAGTLFGWNPAACLST